MKSPHPLGRLPQEWQRELVSRGERGFRAEQVFGWIHQRGVFAPAAMTNLPLSLRAWLEAEGVAEPSREVSVQRSTDGTRKLLIHLAGGARVECVLIPMTEGRDSSLADADVAAAADDDDWEGEGDPAGGQRASPESRRKVTLCVSTQFGCAMGCLFCASGQAGLARGLQAHEIVAQVAIARRTLEPGEALQNLVFMGMGEPLHHYDETSRAIRLLTHSAGPAMSPRRITVSTVGLVPGIRRLGKDFEGKVGLAVSLHAADDATRERIVPINRRFPIAALMQALREYPLPRRRRITVEYTLIAGLNDSRAQAEALARLLRPLPVKINLIPMNPIQRSELRAPSAGRVQAFQEVLLEAGYSCFIRTRRGDDVRAACGQLAFVAEPGRSGG